MRRQVVLGIDPGLRETGWGVIAYDIQASALHFVAAGSTKTITRQPMPQRLNAIFCALQQIIAEHAPQLIAVEEVFINRNPTSTMKLCHARAAAMLAAGSTGVPVVELHNRQIKQAVVGYGNAEKQQMQTMVGFLLPRMDTHNEHAIDALAAAICAQHLHGNVWRTPQQAEGQQTEGTGQ